MVCSFGPNTGGKIELTDIDTGTPIGTVSSREFKQIKPNSGVRSVTIHIGNFNLGILTQRLVWQLPDLGTKG